MIVQYTRGVTRSGATPHLHEQVPTAVTELLYGPPGEIFFQVSSSQILPPGPLREASPPGYAARGTVSWVLSD